MLRQMKELVEISGNNTNMNFLIGNAFPQLFILQGFSFLKLLINFDFVPQLCQKLPLANKLLFPVYVKHSRVIFFS